MALAVASPSVPTIPMRSALTDPTGEYLKALVFSVQRANDKIIMEAFRGKY
jgi:hypothetical protein